MISPLRLASSMIVLALTASGARSADTDSTRLSTTVVPTFEAIRLDLDGGQKTYTGSVSIDLEVRAATDSFRIHALDMMLAKVSIKRDKETIAASSHAGAIGLVTIRPARTLPPGRATLVIDFANDFNTRASSLYRVTTGGLWYAFTDFEPDEARGAWPCFDEPSYKIPWQVTVTIPKGHRAFSNTLPMLETAKGDKRRIDFRRTPPLSSYLVAVMSGPFETVPITGLTVPGRVVTVKGNIGLAGQAVRETPPIVAALESYFDMKYPFEKLDLIGVPEFSAGAMENAAAITYRENRLLLDPKTMSLAQRRGLIGTTAHELAHMWFGDLVTLAWWDDLWLNESFASWMGDKVTAQVAPEFRTEIEEVSDASRAMATDARLTTRAIRAAQLASDNLSGLFDVLSYQKGQAVLNMLERWLSPETFRAGVRAYIREHANGNATAAHLWAALSRAANHDVAAVATTFLDQPGVPLVTLQPLGNGRVRLRQRRFLNYGLNEPGRAVWKIPVTLRYLVGERMVLQNVLLADTAQVVQLDEDANPTWIHPNADESGYYRWAVPSPMLEKLAADAPQYLSPRERVGLLCNLRALLDTGLLDGDQYLGMLMNFAGDEDPEVVATVATDIGTLRSTFVTAQNRDDFAAYVRSALGPALQKVGYAPVKGETPSVSLLRPKLLTVLGDQGLDPQALEWGRKAAATFMKDPAALDPSLHEVALALAALHGDAALFDAYRARFEAATIPTERARFLGGMASFTDDAMAERALRYAVEGPLRPQEVLTIANGLRDHPELKDRVFHWVVDNYDYIAAHVPPSSVAFLPRQADGCSIERAATAREFFTTGKRNVTGTTKELEKMEALVRDCVSLRQRQGEAVDRYLRGLRAAVK